MSVVMIRTADVAKCPAAMQQYIEDYFRPSVFLGLDVMTCSQLLHWDAELHRMYFRKKQGVGPSHSLELDKYKDGLKGKHLNEWMRENKDIVWFAYVAEDNRGGCCVDDD